MNYFYINEQMKSGQIIELPEDESHHALKVLRIRPGDEIHLLNGMGQSAAGIVNEITKKNLYSEILNVTEQEDRIPKCSICIANIKKRDRLEWFIEKSIELGASEIVVFRSEHSEKLHTDKERIEKIAISALKQSGNLWLPDIRTGINFNELISESFPSKYIGHCHPGHKQYFADIINPGKDVRILIGPEGDFSTGEVKSAEATGYISVSLGNLRLRTETAAFTALLTFNITNKR